MIENFGPGKFSIISLSLILPRMTSIHSKSCLCTQIEMDNTLYSKKSKSKKKFTPEEDALITEQVKLQGEKGWKRIAAFVPGRTARQCIERWKNYLSPDVSLSPWNKYEDDMLEQYVKEHGQQWSKISKFFNSRTDVMLKNRWSYLKRKLPNFQVSPVVSSDNNEVIGASEFIQEDSFVGYEFNNEYESFVNEDNESFYFETL